MMVMRIQRLFIKQQGYNDYYTSIYLFQYTYFYHHYLPTSHIYLPLHQRQNILSQYSFPTLIYHYLPLFQQYLLFIYYFPYLLYSNLKLAYVNYISINMLIQKLNLYLPYQYNFIFTSNHMESFSKIFILKNSKSQEIHYYDESPLQIDQNIIQINPSDVPYQNIPPQAKTINTNIQATTKSTKSQKGRPKKRKNSQTIISSVGDHFFSEHQKTIFALIMYYTFKSLQKQEKLGKCGFLHQSIANQDEYYISIKQAFQNNVFFEKQSDHKQRIIKETTEIGPLNYFLQKLIWTGPIEVMDQLIFLSSHILSKFISYSIKESTDQNQFYEKIINFSQQFAQFENHYLWNKFSFINFKNSKLRVPQQQYEKITLHFTLFIKVFSVTLLLAKNNFRQNPYFAQYYAIQIPNKKKERKQNRMQQVVQKSVVNECSQLEEYFEPKKKIKRNENIESEILISEKQKQELCGYNIYLGDSFN